jgi:hypothetical protein
MFQYLATFHKEMCPLFTMSMTSFRCWSTHLARLIALSILLVMANLYISNMGGCHCCCVGAWAGCDCGISCIVGVTRVTSCGGQFSCSTQVVLEMPLHCFHGTFKCVAMQFISGAPLACCDDHCKAQPCIGAFILTLFFMLLTSKHLGVFV